MRKPHCSTWSRLLRYFRLAARMTKPITTLTRAIQPPLRGMRFRYDGKSASRKNGSARPVAKVTMPISGRVLPPDTEAASRVPDERSDAGERGQREGQPHEQRADEAALVRRLIEAGQDRPTGW